MPSLSTVPTIRISDDRRAGLGRALGLFLVSLAAFLPALPADFVRWDDDENFTHNPEFGSPGLETLRWAWTTYKLGVYQPLAWMLLEVEHAGWGLHPSGYHAVSLVLHAINAVVLARLIAALLRRAWPAGDQKAIDLASTVAAALFAVHPLRVEVVAWASCQPYLPAVLFAMLAVLAFLRAHPAEGPTNPRWLALAWGLGVVAVLFKAVAVTLPALLVIVDVYPLGRRLRDRRVWLEALAFFAPMAAFMVVALRAKGYSEVVMLVSQYGPHARVAQAFHGLAFYPLKTLWPVGLSAYYPLPDRVDLLAWPFSIEALAVVAVGLAAIALRRRWPGFLALGLAYVVIVLPNLGLVRIGSQMGADRYAYMASIPLSLGVAWGLARLFEAGRSRPRLRALTAAGLVALVLSLSARTWDQCRTWQTSVALWQNASDQCGGRSRAIRASLGEALIRAGKVEQGAAIFREILAWSPDDAMVNYNYGVYLVWNDRLAEAEPHFRIAIRKMPRSSSYLADAHYNLGLVLENTARPDEAIAEYRAAIALNPRDAATYNNLGAVLVRQRRYAEAQTEFAAALVLRPDYALARRNLDRARQLQQVEQDTRSLAP